MTTPSTNPRSTSHTTDVASDRETREPVATTPVELAIDELRAVVGGLGNNPGNQGRTTLVP